jgi:hypothetical protein
MPFEHTKSVGMGRRIAKSSVQTVVAYTSVVDGAHITKSPKRLPELAFDQGPGERWIRSCFGQPVGEFRHQ